MSGVLQWRFDGAHVLVTGGSHGIGLATATRFRDAGAHVMITGRRPAASDYETDLSGMAYRQLEVADDRSIEALGRSLEQLDILINNAGDAMPGGADQWQPDAFDASLKVNISSLFRLSVTCLPRLRESQLASGASIIGIASLTSYFGFPLTPGYGAAKAGLVALTKTMAVQWGRHNIRVNAVAAGTIETNMGGGQAPAGAPLLGWQRAFKARTPLGRSGQPRDVSDPILFLCSDAARYITGETLMVDGGFSSTMWEVPDMDEMLRLVGGGREV